MSEIKERDILKLLRGKASPKKLKALEEWSAASPANARDLEHYQFIYDESEHLSSYKKVNVDEEWSMFQQSISRNVSDTELLEYFDGLANSKQRQKVEQWRDLSDENREDFDVFNLVLSESAHINSYKEVNVEEEWKLFSQTIKGEATPPNLTVVGTTPIVNEPIVATPAVSTYTPTKPLATAAPTVNSPSLTSGAKEVTFAPTHSPTENKVRSFNWKPLAVAASLLLIGAFSWSIWRTAGGNSLDEEDLYLTFATADLPETITISDGSVLSLDKYTSITYFKDVALTDERTVTIDGSGEFNVASNPDKPFIVQAKRSGVGIRVLGTRFRLEDSEEYVEVIENIEGSVRAYSLADTNEYVVMTAGDKYGFDGVYFVDIKDIPEDYNGKDYDILYVLDYLMEVSDWRVTSGSEIEFDGDAIINIDLEQPYEEILEDLSERANFEYIKLGCDACYEITRFAAQD